MRRVDDLGLKGLRIIQDSDFFSFGIDAILLADFFENKGYKKVLDMGCGNGILMLMLYGKDKCHDIVGLEIQEEVCKLANENIDINNLAKYISVINDDIRTYSSHHLYDAIITNPPYMTKDSGAISTNKNKAIARTEICCDIDDIMSCAKRNIKANGSIFMIHRSNRLVDVLNSARKYNLEPKKLRFIKSYKESSSNMFMVALVKGAKPFLRLEKDLVVYNDDRSYTDEILYIYNMKED